MILFLFSFVLMITGFTPNCNKRDFRIFKKKGQTFPQTFRSYGGMTVSKQNYEQSIMDNFHLSKSCSVCYGNAYICGWDNCLWKCREDSIECNTCLQNAGCIKNCNKCTGFI